MNCVHLCLIVHSFSYCQTLTAGCELSVIVLCQRRLAFLCSFWQTLWMVGILNINQKSICSITGTLLAMEVTKLVKKNFNIYRGPMVNQLISKYFLYIALNKKSTLQKISKFISFTDDHTGWELILPRVVCLRQWSSHSPLMVLFRFGPLVFTKILLFDGKC